MFQRSICFNEFILPKKAWIILINPDTLYIKILNSKYFLKENFLESICQKNNSSCLLKKKISKIDLLKESFKMGCGNCSIEKAKYIFNEQTGNWDIQKMQGILTDEEVKEIKKFILVIIQIQIR